MAKLIFVTGGSASGKTTIAESIVSSLGDTALLLSQDMFYLPTGNNNTNYDIPSAFDWELQQSVLDDIRNNKPTKIPIYSFEKHNRIGWKTIMPNDVVVFEGLFTFWNKNVAALSDFQIFVDTPSDTRLSRRLLRDIQERGRDPLEVVKRWQDDVQPSYLKYIVPMRRFADIIVPWTKVKDKTIGAILSIAKGL